MHKEGMETIYSESNIRVRVVPQCSRPAVGVATLCSHQKESPKWCILYIIVIILQQ